MYCFFSQSPRPLLQLHCSLWAMNAVASLIYNRYNNTYACSGEFWPVRWLRLLCNQLSARRVCVERQYILCSPWGGLSSMSALWGKLREWSNYCRGIITSKVTSLLWGPSAHYRARKCVHHVMLAAGLTILKHLQDCIRRQQYFFFPNSPLEG